MSQWPPPQSPGSAPSSGTPVAQCTVTGTWHPTDDLVNFQGQLVCAEGKQILLDRIMAGESPAVMAARPSALRRFGCIFLDWLILAVPMVILEFVLFGAFLVSNPNQFTNNQPTSRPFILLKLFFLVIGVGYLTYFALLHARNGQTVGKKVGNLRVVNLDGTAISTRTAWLRAFAYVGPNFVVSAGTLLFAAILSPTAFAAVIAIMNFAALGWFLAEVILGLSDRQMQRTLHDRIAGTRVIYLGA